MLLRIRIKTWYGLKVMTSANFQIHKLKWTESKSDVSHFTFRTLLFEVMVNLRDASLNIVILCISYMRKRDRDYSYPSWSHCLHVYPVMCESVPKYQLGHMKTHSAVLFKVRQFLVGHKSVILCATSTEDFHCQRCLAWRFGHVIYKFHIGDENREWVCDKSLS